MTSLHKVKTRLIIGDNSDTDFFSAIILQDIYPTVDAPLNISCVNLTKTYYK